MRQATNSQSPTWASFQLWRARPVVRMLFSMKAIVLGMALMIGAMGCGGSAAATAGSMGADLPPASCLPSASDSGATTTVQATADTTACLRQWCASIGSCTESGAGLPLCVQEVNGGQLLSLYACPAN